MSATTTINVELLTTPHLGKKERATLLEGLKSALDGHKVVVSLDYHKVTSAKARIAGEDYVAMGPKPLLIGEVKKVGLGKNGLYVLLDATLTRRPLNGDEPSTEKLGWTSIKGEGILKVHGVTIEPKKEEAPTGNAAPAAAPAGASA